MPGPPARGVDTLYNVAEVCGTASDSCSSLAVLQMASIRDCLLDNDCERLWDACSRQPWTVSREDWYAGHCLPNPSNVASTLCQWRLQEEPGDCQLKIGGLTRCTSMRRVSTLCSPLTPLHPWQHDPPLSSKIVIDLSNHTPVQTSESRGLGNLAEERTSLVC